MASHEVAVNGNSSAFPGPLSGRTQHTRLLCTHWRDTLPNTSLVKQLRAEWDDAANVCTFEDAHEKLTGRYLWRCSKGPDHGYDATLSARLRGGGCPFCAGKRVSVTNQLVTLFPELARELHPTRNGTLDPKTLLARSNKIVWWKCDAADDHEWTSKVSDRAKGQGCPACAGKQASVTNSVAAVSPDLVREWHETKNGELTPEKTVAGSGRKIWWRCGEVRSHEWLATPAHRRNGGTACPYCAGKKTDSAKSLAALVPTYAAEWHPAKNGTLSAEHVLPGSGKKVWWQCHKDSTHEWQERVIQRVRLELGCPYCSGRRLSPTNSLAFKQPTIAAEWHPTRNGALTPDGIQASSPREVWWKCAEAADHEWKSSPNQRVRNGEARGCPFCRGYFASVSNSVASLFPELAREWHPRNAKNPSEAVATSHDKAWWRCSADPTHEWEAVIASRAIRGLGCPGCSNHQVTATNALSVVAPDIARQWHSTRNASVTPAQVVASSNMKFWWQCPSNSAHEWRTSVRRRVVERTGCPDCMPVWHSRTEVELAFELKQFFAVDLERHKIQLADSGRRLDVDIVLPELGLIVEFDGAYWHSAKVEEDTRKTRTLIDAGWTVLRVREAPLGPVGPLDVVVHPGGGRPALVKRSADAVLRQLRDVLELSPSGLDSYLAQAGPTATEEADEYFIALMTEKAAATSIAA